MGSAFEINKKAAMKVVEEADKLRVEKQVLEDMFLKVKIDLWDFCDYFEEKVVGFLEEMILKLKQLEKMKDQIENMKGILWVNGKMQNLKGERLNGNLFLLKKKDLQLEIKEFEKKLDSLVHKTEKSQVFYLEFCSQ